MCKPDATTEQMLNLITILSVFECISKFINAKRERCIERFERLLWYIELKVKP